MLLQVKQMQKITSIPLKMVEVVIFSENSCHFVSCSACNNIYLLLSKPEKNWSNSPENFISKSLFLL